MNPVFGLQRDIQVWLKNYPTHSKKRQWTTGLHFFCHGYFHIIFNNLSAIMSGICPIFSTLTWNNHSCSYRMKWNDKRLRFAELGRESTMLTIHPELLHRIWKPDVFFSNEKRAEFHSITTENKLLRIDHEGVNTTFPQHQNNIKIHHRHHAWVIIMH